MLHGESPLLRAAEQATAIEAYRRERHNCALTAAFALLSLPDHPRIYSVAALPGFATR